MTIQQGDFNILHKMEFNIPPVAVKFLVKQPDDLAADHYQIDFNGFPPAGICG